MIDLRSAAVALGGETCGRAGVVCPGPGHGLKDRSLSVLFTAGGFVVNSFAGDDPLQCRDHVRERLGWSDERRTYDRPVPTPRRPKPERPDNTTIALRIWRECRPITDTDAERYLIEHRNLDVRGLDLDHVLRWHPGKRAMVALMTDAVTCEPIGIHRTFLDTDAAKLERKMLGRKGVIRLTADEDVATGLGITEGIEDGLRVILSGWAPVWVAGDSGAVAKFPVLSGIEALTIFADHDTAGMKAANTCAARWRSAGIEARIMPPLRGIP